MYSKDKGCRSYYMHNAQNKNCTSTDWSTLCQKVRSQINRSPKILSLLQNQMCSATGITKQFSRLRVLTWSRGLFNLQSVLLLYNHTSSYFWLHHLLFFPWWSRRPLHEHKHSIKYVQAQLRPLCKSKKIIHASPHHHVPSYHSFNLFDHLYQKGELQRMWKGKNWSFSPKVYFIPRK